MPGVSDLGTLLSAMKPALAEGKYYFASVNESQLMQVANHLGSIIGIFRESEGLSLVFSEDAKEAISSMTGKPIVGPFALITLSVNSDLLAVGLLAKVSEALAREGISINAFSTYTHDHLFVPYGRKDDAMAALSKLQKAGR